MRQGGSGTPRDPGASGVTECQTDTDGDGTADLYHNCPNVANADQADTDTDGNSDACDPCPDLPNEDSTDSDGDGVPDDCDSPDPAPTCSRIFRPTTIPAILPGLMMLRLTSARRPFR